MAHVLLAVRLVARIFVERTNSLSCMTRWVFSLSLFAAAPLWGSDTLVDRGAYLVRAAGCVSCHTNPDDHDNGGGGFLAGGRALRTPFGTFFSPNITSDPQYGIGQWSDDDFLQALRHGIAPDGSHYYPAFPYTSYSRLRDEDIKAIAAYLRTVKPITAANLEHVLPWYLWRGAVAVWKGLFFEPAEFSIAPDKDAEYNRGSYLVAIGHCSECHTPRNRFGALDSSRFLAGAKDGAEGESAPNITPHRSTGIGRWSVDDMVYFLETGALPDGDYTGGFMSEVVDDGTSHLSSEDLKAMAVYLKSLPAIQNPDFAEKQK